MSHHSRLHLEINLKKKIKLKKKDKHFVFRGKLHLDRFKNKVSAYILSCAFVFRQPSITLSLVFHHRGVEGRSYHSFEGIPFGIPPLSHTMVSSFCPLSSSASGMAKSRAGGLKERCWAETPLLPPREAMGRAQLPLLTPKKAMGRAQTPSLTMREATGRAAGTHGDPEPLVSPHCALTSHLAELMQLLLSPRCLELL